MSSNDLITNDTLDTCPICLDKMNNNNHIVTSCGHHFHASCLIKNILLSHKSCPCCRKSLEEEDAPNNVLANVVDRQHTFDVILDNISRLSRHNFVSFRDRMYNYNQHIYGPGIYNQHIYGPGIYHYTTDDYKVVGFLKRFISFDDFEDIYVSHTRRNLIGLQNEPYFTIDNYNLIAQHVRYKTEVMCEKYWKQKCSDYWSEHYIRFGKGAILGLAVFVAFVGFNEAK